MHSTFSRLRHSSRILRTVHQRSRDIFLKTSPNSRKATVRGFVPPASGLGFRRSFTKSGRSGGAGYTDPNNQNESHYNWNKTGRESDGVSAVGLVGFG